MKEVILTAFYWIHLTAIVVWIGGIFFILFIAMPATRLCLGAEAGKIMGEISKRFTPVANWSIILLVITGMALIGLNKQFSGTGSSIFILKYALVLGMIIVHFYRGLILTARIMRTKSITEKATLQKLSVNLVKTNFIAGMLVLLLSGIVAITTG